MSGSTFLAPVVLLCTTVAAVMRGKVIFFSERTEELCRQKLLDEKNIDGQKSPELDHQNQNVGDERN